MAKAPVSVLMYLWNEAECVENGLKQLRPYVEEIVIVDQESMDETGAICKRYADKLFIKPRLVCGDGYREFLRWNATQPWLLWADGDEEWPKETAEALEKITRPTQDKWDVFSFMRHEFMDGIEFPFEKFYPNYQTKLMKNCKEFLYPDLIHYNVSGHIPIRVCNLPPEIYMEHHKTTGGQDFDNVRMYVMLKMLVHKYGTSTCLEPYKTYIDSYKQIIHDSEEKNLTGERLIHRSEELWWDWRIYQDSKRITLDEFEQEFGMPYKKWVEIRRKNEERY